MSAVREVWGMTEERCEWMLWNWAQWMHGGKSRTLGKHITHRAGTGSHGAGTINDFDDMVREADLRCAEATDSCIDGLPANERTAIYAAHLRGGWTLPEPAFAPYYRSAVALVGRSLDKRGIV